MRGRIRGDVVEVDPPCKVRHTRLLFKTATGPKVHAMASRSGRCCRYMSSAQEPKATRPNRSSFSPALLNLPHGSKSLRASYWSYLRSSQSFGIWRRRPMGACPRTECRTDLESQHSPGLAAQRRATQLQPAVGLRTYHLWL